MAAMWVGGKLVDEWTRGKQLSGLRAFVIFAAVIASGSVAYGVTFWALMRLG
jgi:hypothetical protein